MQDAFHNKTLINKSIMNNNNNNNNNILNFSVFSRLIRRPPASQLKKVVTASSVAGSYSADVATSSNSHHLRHAGRHHDFQMHRLRISHCDRLHAQRTCVFGGSSWWYFASIVAILGVVILPLASHCEAAGYSYTRFIGPVSGPEHRIYVHDRYNHKGGDAGADINDPAAHLDYVAKPEYEFAYGVEDAQAHVLHNRNEVRDGDAVKGVYSVIDPDGTLRIVKYTADDIYGFQAEVIMNGISTIHGQLQPDTPTTISPLHTNHPTSNDVPYPIYAYESENEEKDNNYDYDPYQFSTHPALTTAPIISITETNDENVYDDGQQKHYSEDEYQPQYEVHEQLSDEEYGEDGVHEDYKATHETNDDKVEKAKDDDTKKDDEDDFQEEDEYDDSDELVDYDEKEKINGNKADTESDEYY